MVDVNVKEVKFKERDKLYIAKIGSIDQIKNIAPAAVHIKEVNHIDPLSIESLSVSEVKNLDPIRIEQLDVTNIPTVNLSVRQVPTVDLNMRRLPPVSVGLHQNMSLPSNYTVRGKLLGFELFRFYIDGFTSLIPKQQFRQEQSKHHNQSFTTIATAGNPGLPTKHIETHVDVISNEACSTNVTKQHAKGGNQQGAAVRAQLRRSVGNARATISRNKSLSCGAPTFNFPASDCNMTNESYANKFYANDDYTFNNSTRNSDSDISSVGSGD